MARSSVTAVDISEETISAVRRNAELNGVQVEAIAENAFDFLKREGDAEYQAPSTRFSAVL